MSTSDVPAEDGARETEHIPPDTFLPLYDDVAVGYEAEALAEAYGITLSSVQRLQRQHAATLAHLAQQADGETRALVEGLMAAEYAAGRDRLSMKTVRYTAEASDCAQKLLAHVAGQAARHREAQNEMLEGLTEAVMDRDKAEAEVARLRARLLEAERWLVQCKASMMTPRHFEFISNALDEIRKGGPE